MHFEVRREGVDCIHLAEDRIQWSGFEHIVVNLRGLF
jgi:hypothetical protein